MQTNANAGNHDEATEFTRTSPKRKLEEEAGSEKLMTGILAKLTQWPFDSRRRKKAVSPLTSTSTDPPKTSLHHNTSLSESSHIKDKGTQNARWQGGIGCVKVQVTDVSGRLFIAFAEYIKKLAGESFPVFSSVRRQTECIRNIICSVCVQHLDRILSIPKALVRGVPRSIKACAFLATCDVFSYNLTLKARTEFPG